MSVPPPTTVAVPLDAPLYGATFGQAFSRFWRKYATFTGRASRSEFWWWMLASVIVSTVLYFFFIAMFAVGMSMGDSALSAFAIIAYLPLFVWSLAILIPSLAIIWRRLHDTNRSGGWFFIGLIPFVGGIILYVLLALDSDPAGARYDDRI